MPTDEFDGSPAPRFGIAAGPAAAAAALAVVVVALCAWLAFRPATQAQVLPARPVVSAAPAVAVPPLATPVPSAGPALTVYVVGQVRRPGVVSLSSGDRVVDAIAAAGGATEKADLAAVNLARRLTDGEQLVVPKPGEAVPSVAPAAGATPASGASGAPVNLNTATVSELDALPGVGPVIAGRIVQWREQNGRFGSVGQLGEVSGIGDATLAKLRPLVTV